MDQEFSRGGVCGAGIMSPLFSFTLLLSIPSEHGGGGGFREQRNSLEGHSAHRRLFLLLPRGRTWPRLPLSGFRGLCRLDGASLLGRFSLLRSISDRYGEDHRFLSHRDDLLVCPLLAQMLLGVVKALHGL